MENELILLSVGNSVFHRQTIYAVLSLLRFDQGSHEFGIVIYTDDPEYFKQYLPDVSLISYVCLDKTTLDEWKGPFQYVFRWKIKAIQHSLGQPDKKILYVDSDVIFRQDPMKLFQLIEEGSALMYRQEGQLTNPLQKNWEVIRQQLPKSVMKMEGLEFTIPLTSYMWNAGVVGLPAGSLPLVEKWLDLTDQYCSYSTFLGLHQDQLVISYLLARYKKLLPSTEVIHHYCYGNEKAHVNNLLKKYFNGRIRTLGDMMAEFEQLIPFPIPNTPIKENILKQIIVFFKRRKTGLRQAVNRVKKTKRPMSFFERGKTY
jgi:hypothetical protein